MNFQDVTLRFLTVALSAYLFTACATIVTGRHQELTFNSNPEGAQVTVNGLPLGQTPFSTMVTKRSGQTIEFKKDGYKPVAMKLDTTLNGWFWGNIVIGGVLGSTTDGMSGAVHQYSPSQYMVSLQAADTGPVEGRASQTQPQKVKDFVVTSYNNILSELEGGKGPYLTSLFDLLGIQKDAEENTTQTLKKLVEIYPNIPEFADRVNDLSSQ